MALEVTGEQVVLSLIGFITSVISVVLGIFMRERSNHKSLINDHTVQIEKLKDRCEHMEAEQREMKETWREDIREIKDSMRTIAKALEDIRLQSHELKIKTKLYHKQDQN